MACFVTWNVQYGRDARGRMDLARIAAELLRPDPPDAICLQEVAVNFAEMGGGAAVDQVAALAALLPGYTPVFGAAVSLPAAGHARFGNLVLARVPVLDAATHPLPRPAETGVKHMARAAVTALVASTPGPVRLVSTHLEFHSQRQRLAQVERLRALVAEAAANDAAPPDAGPGPYAPPPPALGTLLCGDFNFSPRDPEYAAMLAPLPDGTRLADAWAAFAPGRPHPPTAGVHDRAQWPRGPDTCDFVFATPTLVPLLRGVAVDTGTDASDHQPIRVTLG